MLFHRLTNASSSQAALTAAVAAASAHWQPVDAAHGNRHLLLLADDKHAHELAEVQQHRRRYDYVTLSPIFNSISKEDYLSSFDLAQVRAMLHKLAARPGYRPQVLALGGVEAANVAQVRQIGRASCRERVYRSV